MPLPYITFRKAKRTTSMTFDIIPTLIWDIDYLPTGLSSLNTWRHVHHQLNEKSTKYQQAKLKKIFTVVLLLTICNLLFIMCTYII